MGVLVHPNVFSYVSSPGIHTVLAVYFGILLGSEPFKKMYAFFLSLANSSSTIVWIGNLNQTSPGYLAFVLEIVSDTL